MKEPALSRAEYRQHELVRTHPEVPRGDEAALAGPQRAHDGRQLLGHGAARAVRPATKQRTTINLGPIT